MTVDRELMTYLTLEDLEELYQDPKRKIRRMARKYYEESGGIKKCLVCGYDKYVEVCHITAIKDFEKTATVAEVNDHFNLVTLCPNHHWELDNGYLEPEFVMGLI